MATAGQHAQPTANGNGQAPVNGTVIPPRDAKALAPKTPMDVFRGLLDKMKVQIEAGLPTHVDAARFFRVVCTTVQQNPKLLDCTRESLLGRLMQCAQLGLEPDGLLGHAHLVPFNNKGKDGKWRLEVQLIIGYKGLIKLARQSGEVTGVDARVVYEKDYFDYEYGINERLVHRPYMTQDAEDENDTPGPVKAVYAIFRVKEGNPHFEVMSVQQIEKIRKKAMKGDRESPAWVEFWDWMAKKTVIRQTAKLSPASVEDKMARAIALDERAEAGLSQDVDGSGAFITIEDGDKPAGQLPPAEPTDERSTLAQRKTVLGLVGPAKVHPNDVTKWFSKSTIDDFTRAEADDAIARLNKLIAEEKGGAA